MSWFKLYLTLLIPVTFIVMVVWLFPMENIQQQLLLVSAFTLIPGGVSWWVTRKSTLTNKGECSQHVQSPHKILLASLDAIITANEQGRVIAFNPAAESIFGYSAAEAHNRYLTDLIIPERLKQKHTLSFERYIETGEKQIIGKRIEVPAVRANGEEFPVEMTLTSIEQGGQIIITAFLRDLTEKKQAEEQAKIASTVFSKAAEGILVTSSNNRIKAVNPAFLKMTGYQEEEVLGQDPSFFSSGRHDKAFYEDLWEQLSDDGSWEGEIWDRRKNGEIYPVHLSIAVVKNNEGIVTDYVAVLADISQRKEAEEKIIRQATHDPLTELPNRILFFDRLSQALAAGRREGRSMAVLFVDLDNFKPVNDTYGHLMGDKLLKEVAYRLFQAVREVDTIARFGGDEFALVLPNTESIDFAESVAEKLLEQIKRPYVIDGIELVVGCSIGIAIYPHDGETADQLISSADRAMYSAKSAGGNRSAS